jgi:hypothetical protein
VYRILIYPALGLAPEDSRSTLLSWARCLGLFQAGSLPGFFVLLVIVVAQLLQLLHRFLLMEVCGQAQLSAPFGMAYICFLLAACQLLTERQSRKCNTATMPFLPA